MVRPPLRGTVRVVPDKSLTHRGVLLGALAEGRTVLEDPNPGADCRATLAAVRALGAGVSEAAPGRWTIDGGRLAEPEDILDLGNSGTGLRLLAGLLAARPVFAVLTGDRSLRRRPMERIVRPLVAMGASIEAREGVRAPLAVRGGRLRGIDHESPVASAQVKSALLLAGLGLAHGRLRLREAARSRDHTERLFRWSGVALGEEDGWLVLPAGERPQPRSWRVPGDLSAAMFPLVAAAITPGSRVVVAGVGLNPTRTGGLEALRRMGARIAVSEDPIEGPEPVGTVTVEHGPLRPLEVGGAEVPRLIDEIPVLAVAAACADGTSAFRDVAELRVKESDRLHGVCDLLRALGVRVEEGTDYFLVHGAGRLAGARVAARDDHRIAMAALVAGCAAEGPVEVDSQEMIATSDPGFHGMLAHLKGEA